MSEAWQHQVRVTLTEDAADRLRDNPGHESVTTLLETVRRHDAALVSQLEAFEAYLADPAQADTPLGRWTAATLADPAKRAKHRTVFAVRVRGQEVYARAAADALAADLAPLVGHGAVLQMSRHDTDPRGNMPIPTAFASRGAAAAAA